MLYRLRKAVLDLFYYKTNRVMSKDAKDIFRFIDDHAPEERSITWAEIQERYPDSDLSAESTLEYIYKECVFNLLLEVKIQMYALLKTKSFNTAHLNKNSKTIRGLFGREALAYKAITLFRKHIEKFYDHDFVYEEYCSYTGKRKIEGIEITRKIPLASDMIGWRY